MRPSGLSTFRAMALMSVAAAAIGSPAWTQDAKRQFDIPSQGLASALESFGRQSDKDVVFDAAQVRDRQAPSLIGAYEPQDALGRLLSGSGLRLRRAGPSTFLVEPPAPQFEAAAKSAESDLIGEVVVTGSRIRGTAPASPLTVISSDQMRDAGQHDLGEVIRSIPQNFAGGQNPGAGSRSGASSGNTNGGSSTLNLRGIGNDATLTLLNGHRLPSNGNGGVDISAIPIAAVERLEILTDGASALYGSDAVGGVANVITKRTYSGINAAALYGGATDGGFEQHQYSLGFGKTWDDGGLIGSITSTTNSTITARQRSYTKIMNPETALYPAMKRLNAFFSANQTVNSILDVSIDALYSNNINNLRTAYGSGTVLSNGAFGKTGTRTMILAPSVSVSLPGEWKIDSYATYAIDRSHGDSSTFSNGSVSNFGRVCYCNKSSSAELSAEGPVLELPAGSIRLAAGAGYRSSRTALSQSNNGVPVTSFTGTDSVRYGFGELGIPLVTASQHIPLVSSLSANAALRYEDYDAFGHIATPKIGVIYEMTPAISLKGSWGKSFKAPLFAQRYQANTVLLSNATGYGSLYPPNSAFIQINGGNGDLKPERAKSSTITGDFHPKNLPGFKVSISYYHIDFTDRVVYPLPTTAGVITNPLYASFITKTPSAAAQANAIARSPTGLRVLTTLPYDPSRVIAIVDRRAANASKQTIEGFDFSATYRITIPNGDHVVASTSSTYLDIDQKFLADSPSLGITGNFFQPRHFQSRNGATWEHGDATLSTFVNYSGAARYRNVQPILDIKSNTSVDMIGQWKTPRPLNVMLALQVTNVFNSKPTVVPGGQPYESSFDATAYAATGRVVTLQISKQF